MGASIILAQFWAIFMLTFAIIFMFSRKALDRFFSYHDDEKFVFLVGILSFLIGLINILIHNIWVNDWRVIITIFGWIALIKGVIRISFSTGITKAIQALNIKGIKLLLMLMVLLSAYLLFNAYSYYPY